MRAELITIIALLYSPSVFPQNDSISIDLLPTRIKTDITLIVSEGDVMRYEAYHMFKGNYWMSFFDTLQLQENGMLQGRKISIDKNTTRKRVDASDSVINQIRNAALSHRTVSLLEKLYEKEIGIVGSKQMKLLDVNQPTKFQEATIVHALFRPVCEKWSDEQKLKIQEEKRKKEERLEWIYANPEKVDKEYIWFFLRDYDNNESDHRAMIRLIEINANDFVLLCRNMTKYDFFLVKLSRSDLPQSISTHEAVKRIENSPIKTYRKRKVMKLLKKHPRGESPIFG